MRKIFRINKMNIITLCIILTLSSGMQGCSKNRFTTSNLMSDSFSNFFFNRGESTFTYKNKSKKVSILDYETLNSALLCNVPNCNHQKEYCILQRLDRNIPVFDTEEAYYFIDDLPTIIDSDDENKNQDLQLGTTLYSYNLSSNQEKKLFHINGDSSSSQHGWLLHDGKLYYVSNELSRNYDENGRILSYSNVGGNMRLKSIQLNNGEITDYGNLYDIGALSFYYPGARYSASAIIKGIYNNRIYFDVFFVEAVSDNENPPITRRYVSYYDLATNSYYSKPQDYEKIDFGSAVFVSKDYLVIANEHQISVYNPEEKQPIVFSDDIFSDYLDPSVQNMSVFDNWAFCNGKAFNIKTKEILFLKNMENKAVISQYKDNYIISDFGLQEGFEKIPATQLLGGITS